MKSTIAVAAALALSALPAIADEVWTAGDGFDIVYETDIDGHAVLSYPGLEEGVREHAFIDGLAGNYDDRGRHDGYWTGPATEDGGCPIAIVDHNGQTTNYWGKVEVIFLEPGFPSGFVAQRGWCFEEPRDQIVARPVTADDGADDY